MIGGSALSVAPGEDVRYLLASLVVVIVGGMGSITGAAIGALLIGLAEQIGLVYFPTYGVVLTFVIMVVTLAIRPQGIMGNARTRLGRSARAALPGDIVTGRVQSGDARARRRAGPVPARRLTVRRVPDRRADADPGHDRAVADGARRLWRHGLARAAHRRRRRRLRRRDPRRRTAPACSASIGRGELYVPVAILMPGWFGAHRRDRRAHRRHLHDHDHAGGGDRLLLARPAELFACSTAIPAFAASPPPMVFGVEWRDADPVLLSLPRRRRARLLRGRLLRALDVRAAR